MGDPVGYQILCTGIEVQERVRFIFQLPLLVPGRASFATAPNHSLRDDPPSLHRRHVDDVEALGHWHSVRTVAFHYHSIFPIQLHPIFLIEQVKWDLLTIMSRHPQLLTFKLVPNNLRPHQFDLPLHRFPFPRMIVRELLFIDEWRLVCECQFLGVVVLIDAGVDLADVLVDVY